MSIPLSLFDHDNSNDNAECASGSVVRCRGRARVKGPLNGQGTSIVFCEMDINVLTASMKRRVQGADGFDVFITDGGAMMRHKMRGKLGKLSDRGGVCFTKFKTHLANTRSSGPEPPFPRLG